MIKASELRIGNLLKRVDTIYEVEYGTFKICIQYNKQFNLDYKPIPLTEEWLLKFGFYCFHGVYRTVGNIYLTYSSINGWFINGNIKIELKHVHQLQNLYFALTGEELTIK